MSKKKEIEWESWGVQPREDGVKRITDPFHCLYCNCTSSELTFHQFMIGYSADTNFIVMECPGCFGKFYHHIDQGNINAVTLIVEDGNKDFFKVPGTYEKLSKMIERQKKKK